MERKVYMTAKEKDDLFYVCTLIEYIALATANHRRDVVKYFSKAELSRQLRLAEVNHCLTFEQAAGDHRRVFLVSQR